MDFLVIGDPFHLRVKRFLAVLQTKGLTGRVVSHLDLLTGKVQLAALLSPETTIRIETAGEHFPVEKELIRLGAEITQPSRLTTIDRMRFDKGKLTSPGLWYQGWCRYLQMIGQIAADKQVACMNAPDAILQMFDKQATHSLFARAGLPIAKAVAPDEPVESFDHLVSLMHKAGMYRVFIKLRYGAGAMGMVALAMHPGRGQFAATTTLEQSHKNGRLELYNTKTFFTYHHLHAIRLLVDRLCREGVHVEQWIAKAQVDGGPFDIRQVVIGGSAGPNIARIGRGPFTNLHLRSRRKQIDTSWMSATLIRKLARTAEQACALFPTCLYAGVDLLIPRGSTTPRLLEINAFGDLVNQAVYQGKDPYTLEVEQWLASRGNHQQSTSGHETAAL